MDQGTKRRIGEYFMLVGFLMVLGFPGVYFVAVPVVIVNQITTVAITGFVLFMIGAELYLRNRVHWNEIE